MEPIIPQPGSARSARDFVGRARLTEEAQHHLSHGTNLLLTDPRRMGKSYWMKVFAENAPGFTPVLIDYEGIDTAEEFLVKTATALTEHESLPKKIGIGIQHLFGSVDKVSIVGVTLSRTPLPGNPTELLEKIVLLASQNLETNDRLLILMDEVPLAIRAIAAKQGKEQARLVLSTLRKIRAQTAGKIGWIICGSIGFHHVLRQCGETPGVLNDLQSLHLGPLTESESLELAERLLLGAKVSSPRSEAVAMLAGVCGAIPFLMQSSANYLLGRGLVDPSGNDIQELFMDFLEDRDGSHAITHFLGRLAENYEPHIAAATSILDEAAGSEVFRSSDQLVRKLSSDDKQHAQTILDLLQDDHYLELRRGKYRWRYEVLRQIWRTRRPMTFRIEP